MTNENDNKRFERNREFLKDAVRQRIDFTQTAQIRRVPVPPMQKPYDEHVRKVDLPDGKESLQHVCQMPLCEAIGRRESLREFSETAMTLEELSAILYATQGLKKVVSTTTAVRTVPSAGSRHAFETYIAANNIDGLQSGLYRYLPFENQLLQLQLDPQIGKKAGAACLGQMFIARAAFTLFWTAVPERMEWRYDLAAHKVIALDAGHVCQNLYLTATALNAGTCAIAAYDQESCDELLGVDGVEEFTIYLAPVGKPA